jgi:hypothetical protein
MKLSDKTGNWIVDWINNKGGWAVACIVGAFGIIMASSGMIMCLIDFWYEDKPTFFAMLFIGLIVWGVAVFGIWAIINLIKRNKDLFKY